MKAEELLRFSDGPVLVHNVDILSDADLRGLMQRHIDSGADSTLLVSPRDSSRKLIFDESMRLRGWHHLEKDVYRPECYSKSCFDREYAFSGIHVVGAGVLEEMHRIEGDERFSIIDFLLSPENKCEIRGYVQESLQLIDIGKPATLSQAQLIF